GTRYFSVNGNLSDWLNPSGMTAKLPLKYNKGTIANGTQLYVWYKSLDGDGEFKQFANLVIDEEAPTLVEDVSLEVIDNVLKGNLRVTDALSGANRVMATVTYDNGITSDFNFIIDGD